MPPRFLSSRPFAAPSAWVVLPVWVAVVAVAAEAATWQFGWWWTFGGVPLGLGAVVAPVVVVACLPRRLTVPAAILFAGCVATFAAALTVVDRSTVAALVASATGETVVFAVAVPSLVWRCVVRVGARPEFAVAAAATVAAGVFSVLPGHVMQYAALGPAPWMAMMVLWCWLLAQGVPAWLVAVQHAAMNAAAWVQLETGDMSWLWQVGLFSTVAAFVVATAVADVLRARSESTSALTSSV